MNLVASSVPGRLRIRHAILRDAGHLALLERAVQRWPGVQRVEANPRVGSVLLLYDSTQLTPRKIEARLAELLCPAGAGPQTAISAGLAMPVAKRARAARAQVNRLTKRGMLLSLAASTVLAFARHKYLYLHVLTGNTFLAFAAAHMFLYRRSLLR